MPDVSRRQTVPRTAPPLLFSMWLQSAQFIAPKKCCCMWTQYTQATHGI
jgi:hypothetical protein